MKKNKKQMVGYGISADIVSVLNIQIDRLIRACGFGMCKRRVLLDMGLYTFELLRML